MTRFPLLSYLLLPCAFSQLLSAAPACHGPAPTSPTDMSGRPYLLTGACPAHDPAIAYDGKQYYLWATDAGNAAPLLRQWCSSEGSAWSLCAHILPEGLPSWARALAPTATNAWAPDVSYSAARGLWQAYYAVSEFGKTVSALGLATTPTLDPSNASFVWKDEGLVLATNASARFNAIDANAVYDSDGTPYLVFGSFWTGIQIIKLDASTGKPAVGAAITNLASRDDPGDNGAIEGAFLVPRLGSWWLFVSWNHCCEGNKSNYEVRVGRSDSLLGPYVDDSGVPMLKGGGTHLIGGGHGWAAGGGQSLLRATPGMPVPGDDGSGTAPQTIVLHGYDGETGDPWGQVLSVQWNPRNGYVWPSIEGALNV